MTPITKAILFLIGLLLPPASIGNAVNGDPFKNALSRLSIALDGPPTGTNVILEGDTIDFIEQAPETAGYMPHRIDIDDYEDIKNELTQINVRPYDSSGNPVDNIRIYVLIINGPYLLLRTEMDSANLGPADYLASWPKRIVDSTSFKDFRKAIKDLPGQIDDLLAQKGYPNVIVFTYYQFHYYQNTQRAKMRHGDMISISGPLLEPKKQLLYNKFTFRNVTKKNTRERILTAIHVIGASIHSVIDLGEVSPGYLPCGSTLPTVLATQASEGLFYNNDPATVTALLNTTQAILESSTGEGTVFVDSFRTETDFFNPYQLDKFDALRIPGVCDYTLKIIIKELPFLAIKENAIKWTEQVMIDAEKTAGANEVYLIFFKHGFYCNIGTSALHPVNETVNVIFGNAFSGDLALQSRLRIITQEVMKNWNEKIIEILKAIPKKHFIQSAFVNINGDLTSTAFKESSTKLSGYENVVDFYFYEDANFVELFETPLYQDLGYDYFASTEVSSGEGLVSLFEERIRQLIADAGNFKLVKHGLKQSALINTEIVGGELSSVEGMKFGRWYVDHVVKPPLLAALTSNEDDKFIIGRNQIIYDETLASIDALGLFLSPLGLDIITDAIGYAYASYYNDSENQIIYATAVAIPASALMKPLFTGATKFVKLGVSGLRVTTREIAHSIEYVYKSLKQLVSNGKITGLNRSKVFTQVVADMSDENVKVFAVRLRNLTQDQAKKLVDDLVDESAEGLAFRELIKTHPEYVYSYKILSNFSAHRKNAAFLEMVYKAREAGVVLSNEGAIISLKSSSGELIATIDEDGLTAVKIFSNGDIISPAINNLTLVRRNGIIGVISVDVVRGVSKTEFVSSVGQFSLDPELAEEAWIFFRNEDWTELENLININSINGGWPPNDGFKNILKIEKGNQLAGKTFDRFQNSAILSGGFASPVNFGEGIGDLVFTYDSRALRTNIPNGEYYIKFKLLSNLPDDLEFKFGEAIPWFNTLGGADQIKTNIKFNNLILNVHYEILEKKQYVNGNWISVP